MRFFELVEKKSIGKVYIDMDGVIVDLYNYIGKELGVKDYNDITPEQWNEFYEKADAYDLFKNAPAFPSANKLIQLVKDIAGGYSILSKPLNFDREGSIKGKREWLAKHINVTPDKVIFEEDKAKYAVSNDMPNILIDDEGKHIGAWNSAGGFGIKYKADEDSLGNVFKQLKMAKTETKTNENFADGKNLPDEFLKSKFYDEADDCKESTKKFVEFMKSKRLPEPKVIWLAPPKDIKKFPGKSGEGDAHIMPIVGNDAIDFTAKQFGVNQIPFITPMSKVKQVYNKIGGYYTDAPDWVPGKTTHIIGTLNSLPQKALGLAENFADGKKK